MLHNLRIWNETSWRLRNCYRVVQVQNGLDSVTYTESIHSRSLGLHVDISSFSQMPAWRYRFYRNKICLKLCLGRMGTNEYRCYGDSPDCEPTSGICACLYQPLWLQSWHFQSESFSIAPKFLCSAGTPFYLPDYYFVGRATLAASPFSYKSIGEFTELLVP